jgi:hypothetical protein
MRVCCLSKDFISLASNLSEGEIPICEYFELADVAALSADEVGDVFEDVDCHCGL